MGDKLLAKKLSYVFGPVHVANVVFINCLIIDGDVTSHTVRIQGEIHN